MTIIVRRGRRGNVRRGTVAMPGETQSGESCARHQQQAGTGSACQASTGRHHPTLQGVGVTELQGRGCLNLRSFQLSTGPDAGSLCSLH